MDAIKNLYFSQLTPKELLMIKVHKESLQHIPLDKPEQFLWEMTKIHEFANRAFCMIFQVNFYLPTFYLYHSLIVYFLGPYIFYFNLS